MLLRRIQELEGQNQGLLAMFQMMKGEIAALRESCSSRDILPLHPIQGIEVIPKREVVIAEEEQPACAELSYPDRLLLNKKARKALEAEEMGESNEKPLLEEVVDAEVEEAEEEVEEAEEEVEEAEEEVEEEVEEAVELEEFEYKGSTYYRDGDNNVFMTDENGDLLDTPIGTWNEVKKRIVTSKA
jgi:vacuolar-type H+-ATPase subunit I/STV1